MAKKNITRYALLGILSYSSKSGYDIKKSISESIGYFWNENYGHIYTILKRLYEEGCLDKEIVKTEGKPDRIVYSVTPKGVNELDEWLKEPAADVKYRNELLLKIYFSKDMPVDEAIEKLESEYEKNMELLVEYKEVRETILRSNTDPYVKELWLITLNYGKNNSEMILKWCSDSIDSLNRYKSSKNE